MQHPETVESQLNSIECAQTNLQYHMHSSVGLQFQEQAKFTLAGDHMNSEISDLYPPHFQFPISNVHSR
jgi:hypothetical protein